MADLVGALFFSGSDARPALSSLGNGPGFTARATRRAAPAPHTPLTHRNNPKTLVQIKNGDKGPDLRTGHSVVVTGLPNNPKAVIIGGCTSTALVNDVWNLKLGSETLEWEKPKIGQPDSAPSPRWRHTATLLRASRPRRRAAAARRAI